MKKKILSLLTAFAMVFGILVAPFTSAKAAGATKTNSVTLHKLLMTKAELEAWDSNVIEKKGYNGTQDFNAFKGFLDAGHSAHEIAGVFFAWQKEGYKTNENGVLLNAKGDVIEEGVTSYDSLQETNKKSAVKEWKFIKKDGSFVDYKYQNLEAKSFDKAEFKKQVLGDVTGQNGKNFDTSNLDQSKATQYKIVEIPELSTYTGTDKEELADSKAVPVEITLPLVNNDGIVENAHVYPKNTEEKPKVDKDFKNQNNLRSSNKNAEEAEKTEINGGANVDDNQRDKKVATVKLGDKVPYEIKTVIQAKTRYKTLAWEDTMTEGLTFNDDIELKIGNDVATLGTDYIVGYKKGGFTIQLLEAGLKKVNMKDTVTEIYISYSATVNEKAKADVKDKNKLEFHYDNKNSVIGKPEPTKPSNGSLKVTKDFPNVTGGWVTGEEVTVTIVDVATGKPVDFSKLEDEQAKKQSATVVLTENNKEHTWTGLDNNKEYKVIETFKPTDEVTYEKGENGQVIIHDKKKDEPNKVTPSVPEVVLGGKRFVKTNNENKDSKSLERLAGAVFLVKNNITGDAGKGKYLVATKKDADKVTKAKAELDEKVKAYNKLTAEQQKGTEGTTAKEAITTAQNAYNKAFKENAIAYTWGEKTDANIVKLTSDGQGRFEIAGLAYGDYMLEEETKPAGYAKINDNDEQLEFEVKEGSYDSHENGLDYVTENNETKQGKQIKNKKVTIPQTGGIGSLIFIVAGAAIMIGAFVAYKKSQAVEA